MNAENKESKPKIPKKKIPGRKVNLAKHKKTLVGGGLIAAVAIAGIISGIIILGEVDKEEVVLTVGVGGGLHWLDPLSLYYPLSETHFILDQIAEGLFDIEVTSEGSHIIPNLAEGREWSVNGTELTCFLRQGVEFHDGTPFNATAVAWNFERLNRFINDINISTMPYPYMWFLPDWSPIINETKVIDDNTVKFVLNKPYSPFEAILCTLQAYILSPSSTPEDSIIDFDTGKLIGTGPFIYDSSSRIYDPDIPGEYTNINTTLNVNPNYWGGKPNFDRVIFKTFENATLKYEAMVSNEIQYTEIYPFGTELYNNTPGITLSQPIISPETYYILMDNNMINTTMRKAISYALNYTKLMMLVDEARGAKNIRCKSPVSYGIPFSNWEDLDVPNYNLTKARQAIIDDLGPVNSLVVGLTANENISSGNEWETIANSPSPIAEYNFTYLFGNWYRGNISYTFLENLEQIGVKINSIGVTWVDYWTTPSQFYWMSWAPDYIDAGESLHPQFSSKGHSNYANVNDPVLDQLLEDALEEINETEREILYLNIQERLIEEIYPVIWYYSKIDYHVHSSNLKGNYFQTIPYKILFKNAYFE